MLMSVPNVSEGVDRDSLDAIGKAFSPARLLDLHSDPDHHRAVFTLVSKQGELAQALANGARAASTKISVAAHGGIHPHVGAIDVVPVVYVTPEQRGAACAEALLAGELIAKATDVPVFLYGELAGGRERAELRAGGLKGLAERIASGEHAPDFGPRELHATAGATLLSARPPLVAFNVELEAGETLERAKEIAAELRESGGGLPGVRAIGLWLDAKQRAQVSCNLHDPFAVALADVVAFVRERAPVSAAELVGLAPQAAFNDFPDDVPIPGFEPARHILENALGESAG
jgi:glutamate formiminotransferase/glutamate formiminotransferase/formiminotetrahydrofolate cyclodeaminase